MTRIVYPGPGTSAYQSSKFAATVNGDTAYVYGASRTTGHATQLWSAGVVREQSFFTYATDETTTLEITRLAGAITSAIVQPPGAATQAIVAGKLQLTMPPNTRVRIECNGDDEETLHVQSAPLLPAIPAGAISWPDYGVRIVSSANTTTDRFTFSAPHGWTDGNRVRLHSSNGVYPTHSTGTMSEGVFLYVVNATSTDFQVSTAFGGSPLNITGLTGVGTLTFYKTTAPWQALYFPAGDWRVGALFLCRPGHNIYFDGSAHVLGTWDVRSVTPVTFQGHGCLSGRVATWEAVVSDPVPWIMFHGRDNVTFRYANVVDGPIIYGYPYFLTGFGVHTWKNCLVVNPWTYNADGFNTSKHPDGVTVSRVTDCYAFVGDDALYMAADDWSVTCSNTYLSTTNGAPILFGYFYAPINSTFEKRIEGCWAQNYSLTRGGAPADPIIKCWVDAADADADQGYSDATIDGLHVLGTISNQFLTIENLPYPFDVARQEDQAGQIVRMTFRNVTMDSTPVLRSRILGRDAVNTPHDLVFESVESNGVAWTAANFATFVQLNDHPYNIFVDGEPVADFWTTTGAWFAADPANSPWSFLPATGRLGGARVLRLPTDAAWAGTATASRGVPPSIGSYDWGDDTGTATASLSATIAPTITATASPTATASLSATVTPAITATASPAATASLSATVTPSVTASASPAATAELSATVPPTVVAEATPIAAAILSATVDVAVEAAAAPEAGADLMADVDVQLTAAAEAVLVAELSATIEPATTLAADAITPGALVASLVATITPTIDAVAEPTIEAEAIVDVAAMELSAEAEAVIAAALEASVDPAASAAAEVVAWADLVATLSATITPAHSMAAEVESTAALTATVAPEFEIVAEIDGVYGARTSDLVAIRTALLGMLGRSAATNGATIVYEAEPQGAPLPATGTILRVVMLPVTRTLVGYEGEPVVQQDGRLQIQVLFPRGAGMLAVAARVLAIVARYPAQTVVASVGVTLTGSAEVRRIGQENGRIRWDVTVPWRSMRQETGAGDAEQLPGTLQTLEGALEAVRTVWHDRIETARPSEGWAGLRTVYDDVGPFVTPPAVPWAGVWTDAIGTSSREVSTPTETVLGAQLVQIHTDKSLGTAGTDRMLERITAEVNRTFRNVQLGVATLVGSRVSAAGTWQTTLRIPFRFERVRG